MFPPLAKPLPLLGLVWALSSSLALLASQASNPEDKPEYKTAPWRQLFNGKDLSGWKHLGPGNMTVENGLIRTSGGMGLLYWTGGAIGNCKLHVVYRFEHFNDNSGVFIRIPVEPREAMMPVWYGYEVQIDNHPETSGEDEHHITGTLYSLTAPLSKPGKPGPEWNTLDITLAGPRTTVFVNGSKVTDYTEGQPVPARKFDYEPIPGKRPDFGWIGLQNESGKNTVYFKQVALLETAQSRPPCQP